MLTHASALVVALRSAMRAWHTTWDSAQLLWKTWTSIHCTSCVTVTVHPMCGQAEASAEDARLGLNKTNHDLKPCNILTCVLPPWWTPDL